MKSVSSQLAPLQQRSPATALPLRWQTEPADLKMAGSTFPLIPTRTETSIFSFAQNESRHHMAAWLPQVATLCVYRPTYAAELA
jgi:hypothetical protein